MDRCQIRTASDGTVVRVNGDIDQETLDAMAAWVRGHIDSRCHDASPYAMPAIAQKTHGRETYQCGREKGHNGDHRWPDRPDAKWQWPTATRLETADEWQSCAGQTTTHLAAMFAPAAESGESA